MQKKDLIDFFLVVVVVLTMSTVSYPLLCFVPAIMFIVCPCDIIETIVIASLFGVWIADVSLKWKALAFVINLLVYVAVRIKQEFDFLDEIFKD